MSWSANGMRETGVVQSVRNEMMIRSTLLARRWRLLLEHGAKETWQSTHRDKG